MTPRYASPDHGSDFIKRVAAWNKKAERKLHRTFKSTAKKWCRYYEGDASNASFRFDTARADAATVTKKMTELQKLGVSGANIEVPTPEPVE